MLGQSSIVRIETNKHQYFYTKKVENLPSQLSPKQSIVKNNNTEE
jgi:hypothetical protein